MLKSQFFHANSVEKLPKIHEQIDELLKSLDKEDIVSVNTTEIGSTAKDASYSYTMLIIYNSK